MIPEKSARCTKRRQAKQRFEMCAAPDQNVEELSEDDKLANLVLNPIHSASISIQTLMPLSSLTSEGLDHALADEVEEVTTHGSLHRAEAMLVAQAHTLDATFHDLLRRALSNTKNSRIFELVLKLAFRAQNQSRMTLETLSAIKSPPVVFARQMNVAHGQQQVNNGIAAPTRAREREIQFPPNELLEVEHGERLDTRAACAPGFANTPMEPVEAEYRAAKRNR